MTIRGSVWVPIGPSPIAQGGREDNGLTSAIAVNPNNPNIIYQGTAGGGVWRTNDGGTTWTPIFDRQPSLGIGGPSALAIDPNDTSVIYVGTSGRLAVGAPAGLFKSTDGGASFIRLGSDYPAGNTGNARQFFTDSINVIIVDPANSQTIYLASARGVFRSINGGLDWFRGADASGANINGDVRSLALDTSSPVGNGRILYAGIANQGVFQSTNGGRNWAPIFNAATPITAATPAVAAAVGGGNFGKVLVALAPATSPPAAGGIQVLYVSLEGTGGAPDPVGVFVSTNRGGLWTQQLPGAVILPNTQGGYSFHMAVDPASPGDGANDIIYLGAVGQARSGNSGRNFTALAGLHPDTHAWAFFRPPAPAPTIVFCGTDGGLYRSPPPPTPLTASVMSL